MNKILITGATGFVGSCLIEFLNNNNNIIYGTTKTNKKVEKENYNLIRCDLQKIEEVLKLPEVDYVYHCAAATNKETDNQILFNTNVIGTKNIIERYTRSNLKKIIYISTGGVYGYSDLKLNENSDLKPIDYYSQTKLEGEMLLHQKKDINYNIVRLFFPYGKKETNKRLFSRIYEKVMNEEEIQANNNGNPKINPIFWKDMCSAVLLIANYGVINETYNVAGKEICSIIDIIKNFEKHLNKKSIIIENRNSSLNLIANIEKLEDLGFKSNYTLEQGIAEMCNSLKE